MCWTPHATVATIVERDGRFLVVEEVSGGRRVINQPAGHVEENEAIVAAAVRETLEETCWHVEPQFLIGLYTYRAPANGVTYYRFCYAARALSEDTGAELDSDIVRAIWLTRDELAAREEELRSPLVLRCIDDYLAGRRFPLDFVVEHSETPSSPL